MRITRATVSPQQSPGVMAVGITAGITLAAAGGRALISGGGPALLLTGVLLPLLLVAIVVLVRYRTEHGRSGDGLVRQFTLRTTDGRSIPLTLRYDGPRDALQPNDLVRITPGRRGNARVVDVLAGMNGPVVRRLTGRPAMAPAEWLGFAAAVVLLAVTGVLTFGGV